MMKRLNLKIKLLAISFSFLHSPLLSAAQGEMGTGVPSAGLYSNSSMIVWALESASNPMKSGCAYLVLSASVMGADSFKMAVGIITSARLANRQVRFFSHPDVAPNAWGGCQADYVQLI